MCPGCSEKKLLNAPHSARARSSVRASTRASQRPERARASIIKWPGYTEEREEREGLARGVALLAGAGRWRRDRFDK